LAAAAPCHRSGSLFSWQADRFFTGWQGFYADSAANLLLVLALFGLSLILRVICWFFLLEGKFSFSEAFFGMNAGYLLNNVLPFKLGEFGRAALLAGRGKSGFLQVFASIVTERVLDFFLAAFFFLISLPLSSPTLPSRLWR
jgi:hypothetical protein